MTLSAGEIWRKRYGVIRHTDETVSRAQNLVTRHWQFGALRSPEAAYTLLAILDLQPDASWAAAQAPLCGITPIIEFIAKTYRVRYLFSQNVAL